MSAVRCLVEGHHRAVNLWSGERICILCGDRSMLCEVCTEADALTDALGSETTSVAICPVGTGELHVCERHHAAVARVRNARQLATRRLYALGVHH